MSQQMPNSTSPRVALVTGASRGIGKAIAFAFAQRGLNVFLAADGDPAEVRKAADETVQQCAPRTGHGIFDFAQSGEAEKMVEQCLAQFGRVDVLVNNAAIRSRKLFGDFTHADFERVIAVNLAAPFFASQAVLPIMRKQGGGRIIHIASQMGTVTGPLHALYGITKAGLIHLTRSMALELAKDKILVNSVSPGPTASQFNLDNWSADPASREALVGGIPLGRPGLPEEIAEAVAFLGTSTGGFIHGHDLVVDGGYIIH